MHTHTCWLHRNRLQQPASPSFFSSIFSLHAHTHWTKPQRGDAVSGGAGVPRPAYPPQSRSERCFLAQLPTNPIPLPPPQSPTHNSQSMQSLLNYKEGAKQDPTLHNSAFLHDSPITARGWSRQLASPEKRGKNVRQRMGRTPKAEKTVHSSYFILFFFTKSWLGCWPVCMFICKIIKAGWRCRKVSCEKIGEDGLAWEKNQSTARLHQ